MLDHLKKIFAQSEAIQTSLSTANENSHDAKAWEDLGLALAKESHYEDAIQAYSVGIGRDPFHGILYRHRGHRYISVLRFEEAAADLTFASRIIPENWDVWYHLGLAHFLLGHYGEAKIAYQRCYALNYDDESMVAIANWLWITLKRLGDDDAAQALLDSVALDLDIVENIGYYDLLKIYKGAFKADDVFSELESSLEDSLNIVTKGFGLSNYYLFAHDEKKREAVLEFVHQIDDPQWKYAFGYIAASTDLARLK